MTLLKVKCDEEMTTGLPLPTRSNQGKGKDQECPFADSPLVSVGLPTFNGGAKIVNAIMSVLTQDYPKLELVISDNCSSDNTMELCIELGKQNEKIRYFRQPHNIGLMPNFEFALSQASGDLFMWISDDDSLEPGIIQKYVDFLVNNPGYSLVSGKIQHWIGKQPIFCEQNFNFEQNARGLRLLCFYFKVVYGSIFYGLMRTDIARQIRLKNRIGDDWHFIASLAYLGKIKNLECVGYNKMCGGLSKDFEHYSKAVGAGSFASKFPHVQIALDAFRNIMHDSPVYTRRPHVVKMTLALSSFCMLVMNHYGKQYPFILGGRLKRWLGLKTSLSRYQAAGSE